MSNNQTVGAGSDSPKEQYPQLAAVLDTLGLITEQVRAYELILPADNQQARAAVMALGELARQALAEAEDLSAALGDTAASSEHPFTPRELDVLTLAAQGLTNKQIAYRLGVSDRTIQFHMNSIFNKTETSSRTEAATLALARGWLTLDM